MMTKEALVNLIKDDISKMNKNDMYDVGYIYGLIDMAFLTKTITLQESRELKGAAAPDFFPFGKN